MFCRRPRAVDGRHEQAAPSAPPAGPGPGTRPQPPEGARHLVVVVLDSLRHDTWLAAQPRTLARLGEVERRWSYASWTAPSHYNMLTGLMPHTSPTGVFAADYYRHDFLRYGERLGVTTLDLDVMLPDLYLPTFLRRHLGYRTHALVSMPVLNPATTLNRDFDDYRLMPTHDDMAAMVRELRFDGDRPTFHLLNVGETHYPYSVPGDDPDEWPRISGVHGVVRHLAEQPTDASAAFFTDEQLARLRDRQVRALRYLDGVFEQLFDALPRDTWVVVTSDHGELFGEGGYFGHGPVAHDKVLEVPFVEGLLR